MNFDGGGLWDDFRFLWQREFKHTVLKTGDDCGCIDIRAEPPLTFEFTSEGLIGLGLGNEFQDSIGHGKGNGGLTVSGQVEAQDPSAVRFVKELTRAGAEIWINGVTIDDAIDFVDPCAGRLISVNEVHRYIFDFFRSFAGIVLRDPTVFRMPENEWLMPDN